jgi:DNA-binding NarL/FixJ family response regulator
MGCRSFFEKDGFVIRVLLLDDCKSIREIVPWALHVIDPELDVWAVAGVASALYVIQTRTLRGIAWPADVLLLDICLAEKTNNVGGLQILPALPADLSVIIFSGSDQYRSIARANGYILKGTPADEIAHEIRRVLGKL